MSTSRIERARARAFPLTIEGTDKVRNLSSTELIQAFYSHEIAACEAFNRETCAKELAEALAESQNLHEIWDLLNSSEKCEFLASCRTKSKVALDRYNET